jgi:hypothetical protein
LCFTRFLFLSLLSSSPDPQPPIMSGITVQLIFAFVGTRVPYHMCESAGSGLPVSPLRSSFHNMAAATSFSTIAQSSLRVQSANSPLSLGPAAQPRAQYTTQQLLTRLAAIVALSQRAHQTSSEQHTTAAHPSSNDVEPSSPLPSAPPSGGVAAHKAPLLELFDYDTMTPLDNTVLLKDADVLLVLCDPPTSVELVEALQLEWLEAYSGTHRPQQSSRPFASSTLSNATDMAVCTTEERLHNVARARFALCRPVPLHMQLLEKELSDCTATLAGQVEHLQSLKAAGGARREGAAEGFVFGATASEVAERFPLLVELEPSLASVLVSDTGNTCSTNNEGSLLVCERQLSSKEVLVTRMTKQLEKLKELAREEEEKENSFAAGDHAQALQSYVDGAEQDRALAEEIMRSFQAEMMRQLGNVRFLVAHITHLRNNVKKARREMVAVEMVLTRFSSTLQLPQVLEEAEALLRRRVVLRRAARRQLLLLQETEYVDLQRDLRDFTQRREVQKALPPKVRWYLHAPLPSLQPVDDAVATLLDHALIDRDVDEAQELVERTSVVALHDATQTSTASLQLLSDVGQAAEVIAQTLLPVERLVQRAKAAEAEAAALRIRVAELEHKVQEYEGAQKEASPKLPGAVVSRAFPDNNAAEATES